MATLFSTASGNLIIGTDFGEQMTGGAGNDTLIGAGGNDFLDGGTASVTPAATPFGVGFGAGAPMQGFGQTSIIGSQGTTPFILGQPGSVASTTGTSATTGITGTVGTAGTPGAAVVTSTNDATQSFVSGLDVVVTGAATSGFVADDFLVGGRGNDTLRGQDGADHFVFDVQPGDANADLISASPGADFVTGVDELDFDADVFTGLGAPGAFVPDDARFFAARNAVAAGSADDRLVYDTASGALYYDADGIGGADAQLVVTLEGAPTLAASDIAVI